MNEQQEYERFDVDNDYEGGQFIGDEYFYINKRQKRQQTEDDRLYGIFAGSSDEEDGGRKRKRKAKEDFTKPVAFVSKGIVQPSKEEEADVARQDEADGNQRAGLGSSTGANLGYGGAGLGATAGLGLGFQPSTSGRAEEEEDAVEEVQIPVRIREAADALRKRGQRKAKVERQKATVGKDIGDFEQYTKGIGSRIMAKMGYERGQGLGRERQGIARPIDNKLRPKNMGLGFGDYSEHKLVVSGEEAAEAGAAAKAEAKPKSRMWRKPNARKRAEVVYKTADDLVNEAVPSKPSVTIIDMTGRQARVVTNLEHLSMQEEKTDGAAVPMPELQHNLSLLVDLAENDIRKLDEKLRHEKDTAVILGREQQRMAEELEAQGSQVDRADQLVDSILRCQASNDSMTLEELHAVHAELKSSYREEYVMYNLAAVALSQSLPRFLRLMSGWDPLQQPQRCVEVYLSWRWLLQGGGEGGVLQQAVDRSTDPYVRLVCETVLPVMRRNITNIWDPKDPGPLERFFEVWKDALPASVERYILDTLVMPRLRSAVAGWDPLSDTVALHVWIHPWLPYLADELTELYPAIRYKFGNALQAWHPSDSSAYAILSPWAQVFDAKDWEALLSRSIVPKLVYALQQLVVNPGNQDLTAMHWVLKWCGVMPVRMMCQLLEQHFFPQWHAVLHHWLTNSPNYDEVTHWYLGWKSVFPQDLLDHERMRQQMNAALNAMHSAADGKAVPQYPTPAAAPRLPADTRPYGMPYVSPHPAPVQPPPQPAPQAAGWHSDLSLRALVEHFAMENSIVMMPKPGRTFDNMQVYSFGGVSIVMDTAANIIRAQVNSVWRPVALEELLKLSSNKAGPHAR